VFLFGFSRGAYTVRVLAAMLHSVGLLSKGTDNLAPYALRLFGGTKRDEAYWTTCEQFRRTFAQAIDDKGHRTFPVHFMGVWDTVSSVGWIWDPMSYPYTAENSSIRIVRHAVSLDERRWFFRQNLFRRAEAQDLKELWFAGVHADIGGGYPESEGAIWRAAYSWILTEAIAAGLLVRVGGAAVGAGSDGLLDPIHDSLKGAWRVAEFMPKMAYDSHLKRRRPMLGLFRGRRAPVNAQLHQSATSRMQQLSGYIPVALRRP
jgi:uncharacterized protein (DUF2235 family)